MTVFNKLINKITFFRLHNSYAALINKCMQYVHKHPIIIVPIVPTIYPELLKAFGIAKIPMPNELLIKCIKVAELLQVKCRLKYKL